MPKDYSQETKKKEPYYKGQRHDIAKDVKNLGYDDNKKVKDIQKKLNLYMSTDNPKAMKFFKLGFMPVEDKDSLKVDGIRGPRTNFRIKKFLELNEALTSDSVFNKLNESRKEYEDERDKYWKGEY